MGGVWGGGFNICVGCCGFVVPVWSVFKVFLGGWSCDGVVCVHLVRSSLGSSLGSSLCLGSSLSTPLVDFSVAGWCSFL